ncbi:hypothetical protein KO529_22230 [Arenibacter algicola]|uniref:hypothetical protein n=1 Tax=Arenibacter algicola TaxID=616991 RepID=UPI001C067B07|nr:hypothetical protein [Arenibacter algicola]MBU2907536.1 hypothetical protein [Arenibacter algicola]
MKINLNHHISLVVFVFFIVLTSVISAQTNQSLFDVPTAENVLKNVKGKNMVDTYAKQCAALVVMQDISRLYQFKNGKSKIVAMQLEEYSNAVRNVYSNYLNETNAPDKWSGLWKNYYYHTPEFPEEMRELLLSENAKVNYNARVKEQNIISGNEYDKMRAEERKVQEAKDKEEQKITDRYIRLTIFVIGLLLGVFILIKARNWNNKLRQYEFENITDGGVIQFTNFKDAENHRKNKQYAGCLWGLGVIVTIFMIIVFLMT